MSNNPTPDQLQNVSQNTIQWNQNAYRTYIVSDETKLVPTTYDYISISYPTSTSEVYEYKTGGPGGTVVATITVVYTDATKESLSSVSKA